MNAGDEEPARVELVRAGRVLLPGWEYGTPARWIEVRDAGDRLVFSGFQDGLPVDRDAVRYYLLLPPGTHRVVLASGAERKGPREYTVTSVVGQTRALE